MVSQVPVTSLSYTEVSLDTWKYVTDVRLCKPIKYTPRFMTNKLFQVCDMRVLLRSIYN